MDLIKILKNVPQGTRLFSTVHGVVRFLRVDEEERYPIKFEITDDDSDEVTQSGKLYDLYNGECILFPSRENRDWNTFVTDLPELTMCFCFDRNLPSMCIRFYESKGRVFFDGQRTGDTMTWNYIIPCDKYVLATDYFDPKDNYGNLSDKKW